MEFHEKLQELRKQKGLTQDALAEMLFVSRTAISKWESGRGYPNIDSLKAIAKFFSVSIDDLLSSDQVLTIAEQDHQQKGQSFCDLVFGLLDCTSATLVFLPLFGQTLNGSIQTVSLLCLTEIQPYLRTAYFVCILGMILLGLLTLALQNYSQSLWKRYKTALSIGWNTVGVLLFIVSTQPYAAVFLFVFLSIKALLLIKKQ